MTNNDTTAAIFSAIYATLQGWAGSIDEHGLADRTAAVTDEYIEYPADSPMGDWHAAIWATDRQHPGFAAYAYERIGGTYQPVTEPGRAATAYRWTF